jgi:hypothetical protein
MRLTKTAQINQMVRKRDFQATFYPLLACTANGLKSCSALGL